MGSIRRRGTKYNWSLLKIEFFKGKWVTVVSFLEDKGIAKGAITNSEVLGWTEEKKALSKQILETATKELVNEGVNEEKRVRERQASGARALQLEGFKALEVYKPKSAEDARKFIQTGMIQERDALGINEGKKGGGSNLTQVNVNLPKTKLDELLDGLDSEGLLKLLAEIKRQRVIRAGTNNNNQDEAKVIGEGT